MRNQLLVTPTLLDSYDFVQTAPPTWKSRAKASFVATLKREPYKMSAAAKAGIAFEHTVYRACRQHRGDGPITLGSKHFQTVANECYGGRFQVVLKGNVQHNNKDIFLYGKTDVDFPDCIKDLKTTGNWKGADNYLKKWQHKLYLLMSGKPNFKYIVVEWQDENRCVIEDAHIFGYTNPGNDDLLKDLYEAVDKLHNYLHKENLWEDYYFTFSKNK